MAKLRAFTRPQFDDPFRHPLIMMDGCGYSLMQRLLLFSHLSAYLASSYLPSALGLPG
jgi:hypothetical protein